MSLFNRRRRFFRRPRLWSSLDGLKTVRRRAPERLGLEALEERRLLAIDTGMADSAYFAPYDVNQDGYTTALDALLIVNEVHRQEAAGGIAPAAASLPGEMLTASAVAAPLLDLDGDGLVSLADAQLVIDALDEETENLIRIRLEVTDLDGNAISQIDVGAQFLLKGYVLDLRETGNTGAYAAYADLSWDETLAAVAAAIDHGPTYVGGIFANSSVPGNIEAIGGISSQFSPQLGPDERLLFTVTMDATAAGELHFAASAPSPLAIHHSLLFDINDAIPTEQIEYGTASLTILSDEPVSMSILPVDPIFEGNVGLTPYEFTVELSALSGEEITVDYAAIGITAVEGVDFEPASGTLTFAPGETVKTITVNVIANTRDDESARLFSMQLSNASSGAVLDVAEALGTILDDDPTPSLTIVSPDDVIEGDEGTTAVAVTVNLSAASNKTVTVNYATQDGTALAGEDYEAASGTLTFEPGETSKTITINVIGDTLNEATELFTVVLSGSSNASLAQALATVTILDDDPLPALLVDDEFLLEPNEGSADMVFTVTLSAASGQELIVHYETIDGTAVSPDDFDSVDGTLVFAPGETVKTVSVPIHADALTEGLESFILRLTSPLLAAVDATGTIADADTPTLSIATPDPIEEGTGENRVLEFTVTLSAESTGTVTVDYATVSGTAAAGEDFIAASGTLTFEPGQTVKVIEVTIVGDALNEATETFTVVLSAPANALLAPGESTAVGTILDDDPFPTLSIEESVSVIEGDSGTTPLTFTVTLSAPSGQTVTVDYSTSPVTAEADVDYVSASGTLTFLPGETTKTITIDVIGDTLYEDSEAFTVILFDAGNAEIDSEAAVGTGVILNDDAPPLLMVDNELTAEPDEGSVDMVFTVTLSAPAGVELVVDYETIAGTATSPDDFTAVGGTLVFAPGQTVKMISVPIHADDLVEGAETFTLRLTSDVLATVEAVGTIADADTPLVSITAPETINEGDVDSTVQFVVTLSQASSVEVTVDFATAGGTATQDVDFVGKSGTLTFAPGEMTKIIEIVIKGDLLNEADETFTVSLSNPSNAELAPGAGSAIGTIIDDDPPPSVSIATPEPIVEGDSGTKPLVFTVTLSAASGQMVTVDYATGNGTANAGVDFVADNGTLTFAPGETVKTITVQIIGDVLLEEDETFQVTLFNPVNATLGTSQAIGTILDDDDKPTVTIGDASVVEGTSGLTQMVFTISLSRVHDQDVTVRVNSQDGTALANVDYRLTRDVLVTIPAGQLSATIEIDIGGDIIPEGDETFTLEISSPANATLGEKTIGVGTIIDDDPLLSVSGYAYVDSDNDGHKGAGEKPLAGVLIQLAGEDLLGESVDLWQLTGADGSYRFDNLMPGNYHVVESQPHGLLDGKDRLHDGNLSSFDDRFVLSLRQDSLANNNFGERGVAPQAVTKRLFFASGSALLPAAAPALAVSSVTPAVNLANAKTTTVGGTGSPGAHIAVVATDGAKTSVGYTTTVAANGTWSISGIDVSMLADGAITYQAAASDAYGNAALASIATTKTTVAITSVTNPVNAGNVNSVSVSGTGQAGASITLVVTDVPDLMGNFSSSAEYTATVAANGAWSISGISLSMLDDGRITFSAAASDGSDNSVTARRKGIKGTQ